jgi:CHASE1-domain containing sensor protein
VLFRSEDGSRADYKLMQDVPPAEIRLVALLEGLQAIGIAFSSKLESNAAKLEDMGRKATRGTQRAMNPGPGDTQRPPWRAS